MDALELARGCTSRHCPRRARRRSPTSGRPWPTTCTAPACSVGVTGATKSSRRPRSHRFRSWAWPRGPTRWSTAIASRSGRSSRPGSLSSGATVTLRIAGGLIAELTQELETRPAAGTEPRSPIDDTVAALIDGALDNRTPVIVAYVDAEGVPHQSPRGTVQVWSPDQLAMWIRDPNGGLLRAIADNPQPVVLLPRPEVTRRVRAHRTSPAPRRSRRSSSACSGRSPRVEQNLDPMMRGVAIVVDLDVVAGGGPGPRVNMRRERSA